MSLNVKNEEAYRLAQAIAEATGETLTYAVTQALRERYAKLERLKAKASVDEILGIAGRVSCHVKAPYLDHGELLYGEDGLPK